MKIKPLGTYVLVKVKEIEEKTEGGIVIPEEFAKKEQAVTEQGVVVAFGPCCYKGWTGCESPRFKEMALKEMGNEASVDVFEYWKWFDPDYPPHKNWGVDIGMKVEFRKYEGKKSIVEGYENYRYIPDTHILGVIDDE